MKNVVPPIAVYVQRWLGRHWAIGLNILGNAVMFAAPALVATAWLIGATAVLGGMAGPCGPSRQHPCLDAGFLPYCRDWSMPPTASWAPGWRRVHCSGARWRRCLASASRSSCAPAMIPQNQMSTIHPMLQPMGTRSTDQQHYRRTDTRSHSSLLLPLTMKGRPSDPAWATDRRYCSYCRTHVREALPCVIGWVQRAEISAFAMKCIQNMTEESILPAQITFPYAQPSHFVLKRIHLVLSLCKRAIDNSMPQSIC